jgi:predicted nucleic acid-binding protein
VTPLLCDSGPLIATYNRHDPDHERSVLVLGGWRGKLMVPEPVLGETCNFLRNGVRRGAELEAQFLAAITHDRGDFEIVDPTSEDRLRAAELVAKLVSGPLGHVDATLIAMSERLRIPDIATVDFKLLGMASPVSRLKPLRWVLQEG